MIIILCIFFIFIIFMNFVNKTREGACSKDDRECSKMSLYTAEQNAPIIDNKISDTKNFLDTKIDEIKEKIDNLVKEQTNTKKLIDENAKSIIDVKKEL